MSFLFVLPPGSDPVRARRLLRWFTDVRLFLNWKGCPFPLEIVADPEARHVVHVYPDSRGELVLDDTLSMYRGANDATLHIHSHPRQQE